MTGPGMPDPSKHRELLAQAADLVAHEDAEAREAFKRPMKFRRRAEIAVIALAIGNVFAWFVFPPAGLDASDQRTPAAIELDLRLVVGGVATDVDAWRAENGGALPGSLEAAGLEASDVEYARNSDGSYMLRAKDGDLTVAYDSRTPLAEFSAAPAVRP